MSNHNKARNDAIRAFIKSARMPRAIGNVLLPIIRPLIDAAVIAYAKKIEFDLECEDCEIRSIRVGTVRAITDGSVAQYPMADRTSADHTSFDHVTIEVDVAGREWWSFHEGCLPFCRDCMAKQLDSGLFVTNHVVATCTTGDCAEMKAWIDGKTDVESKTKEYWAGERAPEKNTNP